MKRATEIVLAIVLCCSLVSCGSKVKSPEDFYDLGVRYLSEGNYEEAVLAFNTLLQIEPNHVDGLFGRGQALQELGGEENIESAQADYRAALDLDQSNEQIWFALTDLLIENGQEAEAKDLLAQAYEIFGNTDDISSRIEQLKDRGALEGDDLSRFGLIAGNTSDFQPVELSQEDTEEITDLCNMYHDGSFYQRALDLLYFDCLQPDAEQRAIHFILVPHNDVYALYFPWTDLYHSYDDPSVLDRYSGDSPVVYTDPLQQLPLGTQAPYECTEYVRAPGENVDWILRNIFNVESSHPSSAVEISDTEFGPVLYYCQTPWGIGSSGPDNQYTLYDVKQSGDYLYLRYNIISEDEMSREYGSTDNWEGNRWVLLKKNSVDGESVWSVCYIGAEELDDVSGYMQ